MEYQWILFCPQLPATPSSPRVSLWRRMRTFGALGLDNGLWVLPNSKEAENFIEEIRKLIIAQGGSSNTFLASALDKTTENGVLAGFLKDRSAEYAELNEQCLHFLGELEKETLRSSFTFAELEENEADLNKLEIWHRKVANRDFLQSSHAQVTEAYLEKCRMAYKNFSEQVFTRVDRPDTAKMINPQDQG